MSKTYYIFRHGETYFSKNKIHYGESVYSAEILPEFVPTVKKLAEFLKGQIEDANFASPYLRTRQTVEIVREQTGKEFTFDDRLGEEMITTGKESYDDLIERLSGFMNDMEKSDDKVIALCSHGWPIAALVNLITKGEMKYVWLDNMILTGQLAIIRDKQMEVKSFR